MSSWCRFGSAPRRPKRRPRGPKTPPRAPQEAPRGPQERPKRLQEALKRPQEPVKRALQLQRCLAKMPCHRMQGGHAKKWRAGGGVPPKGQAIRRALCPMRVRSRPSTLPQLPSPNYPLPITLTLFQLPSPNYPITHYPFHYPIPLYSVCCTLYTGYIP